MRVILAKTLLVIFLSILPFQQAHSQAPASTDSSTVTLLSDLTYRIAVFNGIAVSMFCRSGTNHCLVLSGGWAIVTVLVSYPVQGTARKRCNRAEGESSWCALPGADRDFTHLR